MDELDKFNNLCNSQQLATNIYNIYENNKHKNYEPYNNISPPVFQWGIFILKQLIALLCFHIQL